MKLWETSDHLTIASISIHVQDRRAVCPINVTPALGIATTIKEQIRLSIQFPKALL